MLALDTNAVSALFDGDQALRRALGAQAIALPVIVVGEYRVGLQRSKHRARLEALLASLIEGALVLPVTPETTKGYASVRERLRQRGTPLPENDVWIAALCLEQGLPLVSQDRHFENVEGLRALSWP